MMLYALWYLGTIVGMTPLLLGLVLLGRREWALGSIALAITVVLVLGWQLVCRKTIARTYSVVNPNKDQITRLEKFETAILGIDSLRTINSESEPQQQPSANPGVAQSRPEDMRERRRSNASIFELMSALLPTKSRHEDKLELPLKTEAVDDHIDTRRAIALGRPDGHNNTPHVLPPLPTSLSNNQGNSSSSQDRLQPQESFQDSAQRTMYPTFLIAPNPTIWLSDDDNGIGRMEAADLKRWHGLDAVAG